MVDPKNAIDLVSDDDDDEFLLMMTLLFCCWFLVLFTFLKANLSANLDSLASTFEAIVNLMMWVLELLDFRNIEFDPLSW